MLINYLKSSESKLHEINKACPVKVWLGKLTALDMTPLGWLGHKTSTQTKVIFF